MKTDNRKIGDRGEDLAEKFLKNKGYRILSRNYSCQGGEIDIIAGKHNVLFFVEVKAIDKNKFFLPEENIHFKKQQRLIKTARTYLSEKKYPVDTLWQIDAIIVRLADDQSQIEIEHLENVIWEVS